MYGGILKKYSLFLLLLCYIALALHAQSDLSPYFSAELYQAIGGAAFFDVARMRYRPGVEIEVSDKWALDVFYCYQYEPDKSKHIVGVECSFSF